MIEIFPSKLEGGPLERHSLAEVITIEAWLKSKVRGYEPRQVPPISIVVNGDLIAPAAWGETEVVPDDHVAIYIEPKGSALKTIFKPGPLAKLFGLGNPFDPVKPATPNMQNRSSKELNLSTVKGNLPALNDVIPELAGSPKRFPDLLAPVHRYFGDPTEQWAELLLCIGRGKYQVLPSGILVGDTPIASLGATARYAIYGPGEDLASETAAQWWHSATEVGATNTGNAGLTLTTTVAVQQQFSGNAVQSSDFVITVPEGAGWFPFGWTAGMIARIEVPYPYTFTAPADGSATVISGKHLPMLQPFVGMRIEIAGANAGDYVVATYDPEVPGTPEVPGSASMVTGSAAPNRFNFDVVPLSFTVTRGASSFPVTLNTATTNLAGLVAAVNSALAGTPLVASASSGRLRIAEQAAPYSGVGLGLTGSTSDVFGVSPTFVTGTKSEVATDGQFAKMTLAYDGGAPVVGLQAGELLSTIGYRDLRYRITAVSDDSEEDDEGTPENEAHGPSAITVARLTDNGAEDGGWGGFDPVETNDVNIVLDGSTTEGDWSGPIAALPPGEVTRRLEVDFFFPQGLIRYTDKNGNPRQVSVKVEIQYRDIATAGPWTSVTSTYTATSPDQMGYTRKISLPTFMRPEVRVRRIGEESTSSNKQDRVQWFGLRARIERAPRRYEGVTVMVVYIKGSNRLSAQSQTMVSVRATRVLPVRSGGAWAVETPTREIVPWVAHVARTIGYTDDDLDLVELDRLDAIWRARGDTFDLEVNGQETVLEALNTALMAGFAELTIDRGLIRPVRDEPRSVYEHLYTPQSMTVRLARKFTGVRPDDYDGVDVEYTDEDTWQKETVKCRLPGDQGLKTEKITLKGVINRDRAWRIGIRQRRRLKYQRHGYTFSTELAAMNSRYKSYCAASDDIPGYGQSSLLVDFQEGNELTLLESSEPLPWEEGASHVVGLRRPDGTLSGPWPATRVDETRLTVPQLDFVPDLSWSIEPPHLQFGTTTRWSYPILIGSIKYKDFTADVEAVNYDVRVYADDNNFAPT
ncbi:host specificity factor TipJ family phage tail protein [Pseudomonas plecoglossicida]|uniref:host specificity factor TipJ family phage tail protein n=1 Tax=Pseudomonas TaxID=286 RepID=UPI00240FD3A5|nr:MULTISPECIES: host specificity factor TipJ family phage tail protein [Pseudomonas]MDN5518999.1 phage tail protein [Pseudomonas sp.]MDN5530928.1 phage tail protein [Pseudomonas sp.]MDQ7962752.1 host specificity factor TipJ family phage tail protein [Pseudomonas plecoglossicida]WFG05250.1 host specificity factor TipJ family phage tail protein [Pseudomonas putida]